MALILVRLVGEIGVKGKNPGAFVKRLRRNLRDALKKNEVSGKVWSENQRAYVEVEETDWLSDPEVERVETTQSGASRQSEFVVYLKQMREGSEEEME